MIRATPECSVRGRGERASKGSFEVTKGFGLLTLRVLGEATSLGLKTKLGLGPNCQSTEVYIQMRSNGSQESQRNMEIFSEVYHDVAVLSIASS